MVTALGLVASKLHTVHCHCTAYSNCNRDSEKDEAYEYADESH